MSESRLTKKQKKGIAFRQKKKGGRDHEQPDVPVIENQDLLEAAVSTKGAAGTAPADITQSPSTGEQKKRKRNDDELEQPQKKTKGDSEKASKKHRFILFVGNLKYTTPKEAIQAHFSSCGPLPTVRLLTDKLKGKSKGCAFVEFQDSKSLGEGLKFHQSTLDGKIINVELTAGGGGNGESRLNKLRNRNKGLAQQRVKHGGSEATQQPQRHSRTSGQEKPELGKEAHSVDNGGKTRSKKRVKSEWGTGVNTIPIG